MNQLAQKLTDALRHVQGGRLTFQEQINNRPKRIRPTCGCTRRQEYCKVCIQTPPLRIQRS